MADLLYISISNELEQNIKMGILKENDKLSERKLTVQYGVSRTVIREALKYLNEKGLVTIKSGKGNYVTIPDKQEVMGKLENVIDNSSVDLSKIVEARELLEKSIVGLIIKRSTTEDITYLSQLIGQMETALDDEGLFGEIDAKFHLRLIGCSQNEVLQILMGTLNNLTNRREILRSKSIRKNAIKEHKKMINAVKEKDEEMLVEAIESHLSCIKNHMKL